MRMPVPLHVWNSHETFGKHEFEVLENERHRKVEEGRSKKEESLHPERTKSYLEMSLKQKIDYYHPIVFTISGLI